MSMGMEHVGRTKGEQEQNKARTWSKASKRDKGMNELYEHEHETKNKKQKQVSH
jgi:hypothetical protein